MALYDYIVTVTLSDDETFEMSVEAQSNPYALLAARDELEESGLKDIVGLIARPDWELVTMTMDDFDRCVI